MPMSDGQNVLKKIAFQIGNRFFRFALNPENFQLSRPHRTTALKTKSRIIIEDFQSDIPTITISGTTGFNPTGRAEDRGIAKIKEMKAYLEAYAEMGGNGNTSSQDFYFHDFTNDESYVVHLSAEGVQYTQDVNAPLMHRYQIKFVILRRSTDPADEDVINPEIGNRYPSIPGVGGAVTMPRPSIPDTSVNMPGPVLDPGVILPMPSPIVPGTPNTGGTGSGGTTQDDIYNGGTTGPYVPSTGTDPINPQAPSFNSFQYGTYGLGFNIGYYGRSYAR
jgi:hypothetical protein